MTIGQMIRNLRENAGATQAQIAKRCGVSQATIGKIERGEIRPTADILVQLADIFDVSLDYLCGRTDKPQGQLYKCDPKINIGGEDIDQFVNRYLDPDSPYSAQFQDQLKRTLQAIWRKQHE